MHIRMQVRGSDKKRPQLAAATACTQRCTTTLTAAVIHMPGYEGRREQGGRGVVRPPPPTQTPAFHPSSLTKRPTEKRHNDSCGKRDPGVQSGVPAWWSAAHGGMDGRTAGPADHSREPSSYYYARSPASWRARRRFWRGDCPSFLLLGFTVIVLFSISLSQVNQTRAQL